MLCYGHLKVKNEGFVYCILAMKLIKLLTDSDETFRVSILLLVGTDSNF